MVHCTLPTGEASNSHRACIRPSAPPFHPSSPRTFPEGTASSWHLAKAALILRSGFSRIQTNREGPFHSGLPATPVSRADRRRPQKLRAVLAIATRPTRVFLPAELANSKLRTARADTIAKARYNSRSLVIDSNSAHGTRCERTIDVASITIAIAERSGAPAKRARERTWRCSGHTSKRQRGPYIVDIGSEKAAVAAHQLPASTPSSAPMRAEPGSLQSAAA